MQPRSSFSKRRGNSCSQACATIAADMSLYQKYTEQNLQSSSISQHAAARSSSMPCSLASLILGCMSSPFTLKMGYWKYRKIRETSLRCSRDDLHQNLYIDAQRLFLVGLYIHIFLLHVPQQYSQILRYEPTLLQLLT